MEKTRQGAGLEVEMPEKLRRAARLAPESWIQIVDPAWPQETPPPVYAIAGGWRIDANGEPAQFEANPDYRPSPRARGLPEPSDPVDQAVQLGGSGYGPPDAVLDELLHATVAVPIRPDGTLLSGVDGEGARVIAVYSSPTHAETGGVGAHRVMSGQQLAIEIPEDLDVLINPDGVVAARISARDLRARLATNGASERTTRLAD